MLSQWETYHICIVQQLVSWSASAAVPCVPPVWYSTGSWRYIIEGFSKSEGVSYSNCDLSRCTVSAAFSQWLQRTELSLCMLLSIWHRTEVGTGADRSFSEQGSHCSNRPGGGHFPHCMSVIAMHGNSRKAQPD